MTNKFNSTYRKNSLKILEEVDLLPFGFALSAPTKIAGTKRLAFSLPAGPDFTCPGATEACVDCYAQKGRHHFSSVQKSFIRNWTTLSFFSRNNDYLGAAEKLLELIPINASIFRIHESGDFENQFAIDVWEEVIRARPNTKFWFYTRSFKLDFSKILSLPNVTAWASTDSFNAEEARAFAEQNKIRQAFGPVFDPDSKIENSFICPVTSGKLAVDAACEKCKLCVDKNKTTKNVVFLAH